MPSSISFDPFFIKLIISLHHSPELLKESQEMEKKIKAFYHDKEAVYYTGVMNSMEELKEFINSPAYQQLKLQCNQLELSIERFLLPKKNTEMEANEVGAHTFTDELGSMKRYFQELFSGFKRDHEGNIIDNNRFGMDRVYLFSDGKKYLEEIALLIHDKTIPLAARQNAIINLVGDEGLVACGGGCLTRLKAAAESLKYNLDASIPKQLMRWIGGLAQEAMRKSYAKDQPSPLQSLLNELETQSGKIQLGNSVHMQNFLIDLLAKNFPHSLSFLEIKDSSDFYNQMSLIYNAHDQNQNEKVKAIKAAIDRYFNEYVVNFKKMGTTSALIELLASDISVLARQKEGQVVQSNFIKARLDDIGKDEAFSVRNLYSTEDYNFLGENSLKITILERLFNAGWLTVDLSLDSDLKRETSYFYQHNVDWRAAQSDEMLPFNPRASDGRYHIVFSNVDLSWIKINSEGESKRHLFLDLIQKNDGLKTLKQALINQGMDPNNPAMINSLLQTPDDLNLFLETFPDLNQRLVALAWLDPLLVMSPGNANEKIDWPFSGEELISFLRDEKTRFLFLLQAKPETVDSLAEKIKHCLREEGGYKGALEDIVFPPLEPNESISVFTGKELTDVKFKAVRNCEFHEATLNNVAFEHKVDETTFGLAKLTVVNFYAEVSTCSFDGTELIKINFNAEVKSSTFNAWPEEGTAHLTEVIFKGKIDASQFNGVELKDVVFNAQVKDSTFNVWNGNDEDETSDEMTHLENVIFEDGIDNSHFYGARFEAVEFKDKAVITGCHFDGASLTTVNFEGEVKDSTFNVWSRGNEDEVDEKTHLNTVVFEKKVENSEFQQANLASEVNFKSEVTHCKFNGADLQDASFKTEVSDSIFDEADLSEATFSKVTGNSFLSADLSKATFKDEVKTCDFRETTLIGTVFNNKISNSNFEDTDLTHVIFEDEIHACKFNRAKLSEHLFLTLASDGFKDYQGIDYRAVPAEIITEYLQQYLQVHPQAHDFEPLSLLGTEPKLPDGMVLSSHRRFLRPSLDVCGSGNRRKREVQGSDCFISEEEIEPLLDKKRKVDVEQLVLVLDEKGFSAGKVSDTQRKQFLNWAKSENIINPKIDLIKLDRLLHLHAFHARFNFLEKLSDFGRGASTLTSSVIAKDMLAEFKRGEYKELAINLGVMHVASLSNELAEKGLQLGSKLFEEGRIFLGSTLKFGAPLLSRGPNSAFITYDLIRQMQRLKAGDRKALVPLIGDSLMVGTDATGATIEALVSVDLLAEEISAVTGPVGEILMATIIVGMQIYSAVKKVDAIQSVVHLTAQQRLTEGWRAFIGARPEPFVQEAMQKKEILQQYLTSAHDDLKKSFPKDVIAYLFPAIHFETIITPAKRRIGSKKKPTDVVHVTYKKIPNNQVDFVSQRWDSGSFKEGLRNIEKCERTGRGSHYRPCKVIDGKIYEKQGDIYMPITQKKQLPCMTRVSQNYASLTLLPQVYAKNLFCLPTDDSPKATEINLSVDLTKSQCINMLGFWNPNHNKSQRPGSVMVAFESGEDQLTIKHIPKNEVFNFILYLGEGNKTINTLNNSSNVTLILEGKSATTGSFQGSEQGYHTLVLQNALSQPQIYLAEKNNSYVDYPDIQQRFSFNKIDKLIGVQDESDEVIVNNNNQKGLLLIDTQGGYSADSFDWIHLTGDKPTQRCIAVTLRQHTGVINTAHNGSFVYIIPSIDGGRKFSLENTARIKLLTSGGEHAIQFDHALSDIMEIDITNNQELKQSTLRFVPAQLDLATVIECKTERLPKLVIGFSDNSYFMPNKNNYHYAKRISSLDLESAIEESIDIANRHSITIMTDLPESKEAILVAGFQKNAHILYSSPVANTTYLIGINARENNYVIMPSAQNQTTVQVEVRRPDMPIHPVMDRLDFDELTLACISNYPELKRENFWIQVQQTQQDDLEIILRVDQNELQRLNIIRDQSSVLASVLLKTGVTWHTQLQVKLFNILRKIVVNMCSAETCHYGLQPLPLTFSAEKKFISINPDDVIENNHIILEKSMEPLFYREGDDLIVTDTIQPCVHESVSTMNLNDTLNKTTLIFGSYYTVNKMQTLVLDVANNRSFPLKDYHAQALPWQSMLDCHHKNLYQEIFSDQAMMTKPIEIATAHRNSNPLFVSEPDSLSSSSGAASHKPFWLLHNLGRMINHIDSSMLAIKERFSRWMMIKTQTEASIDETTAPMLGIDTKKSDTERGGISPFTERDNNAFKWQNTRELTSQESPKAVHSSLPINYKGTFSGNVCLGKCIIAPFWPSVVKRMQKVELVVSQADNTSDSDWAFKHLQEGRKKYGRK